MSGREIRDRIARIEVSTRAAWRLWLEQHHGQTGSVWLVTWKQGRGPYVPYAQVRDEALCFGWIDSRPAKLDANRSMLLMSPRRGGSRWSRVNKERVAALTGAGMIALAGLAKVERAKSDGTWLALDDVGALVVPDDLGRALAD